MEFHPAFIESIHTMTYYVVWVNEPMQRVCEAQAANATPHNPLLQDVGYTIAYRPKTDQKGDVPRSTVFPEDSDGIRISVCRSGIIAIASSLSDFFRLTPRPFRTLSPLLQKKGTFMGNARRAYAIKARSQDCSHIKRSICAPPWSIY